MSVIIFCNYFGLVTRMRQNRAPESAVIHPYKVLNEGMH